MASPEKIEGKTTNKNELTATKSGGPTYNVADLIVGYLNQLNVKYVFGVPSASSAPIYNSLHESEAEGGVSHIAMRDEASAAFMAQGYYREAGKMSVCCAGTKIGAIKMLSGMGSMLEDRIPLLIVTTNENDCIAGYPKLQNVAELFESYTKYSNDIVELDDLELILVSALTAALENPKGPVHLHIPHKILSSYWIEAKPRYLINDLVSTNSNLMPTQSAIAEVQDILENSKKTVIIVGDYDKRCSNNVEKLAHSLKNARVMTTAIAKGLINSYNKFNVGVIGPGENKSASEALNDPEIETLLLIGKLSPTYKAIGHYRSFDDLQVIALGEGHNYTSLEFRPQKYLFGDIDQIINTINSGLLKRNSLNLKENKNEYNLSETSIEFDRTESISVLKNSFLDPAYLFLNLPRLFPKNTRYIVDGGSPFFWAAHYLYPIGENEQTSEAINSVLYRTSHQPLSSCGWGVGNAIGVAFARPKNSIVCITTDGNLLANSIELTVAAQNQLPLILLMLNERSLALAKHGQRLCGDIESGTDLPDVNWREFASSLGIKSIHIESEIDFESLSAIDFCTLNEPLLIEVCVDSEIPPPMAVRTRILRSQDSTFSERVEKFSDIPIRVYLDTYPENGTGAITAAIELFVKYIDFSLTYDSPESIESWFKTWVAKSKSKLTSDESRALMEKGLKALELAKVDLVQSEVNLKNSSAAAKLIESIKDTENAAIQIGSLLVVKTTDVERMGSSIGVHVLTSTQMILLEKDPALLKSPRSILQKLAVRSQNVVNLKNY